MIVVVAEIKGVVMMVEMVTMMVEVERTLSSEVFSVVLDWLGLASIWQQTRSP